MFNLIILESGLLADALSDKPNTGGEPAPITDPAKVQEALKTSYANLQAIMGVSDKDLQTHVKLLGEDMTKQDALMLILEDQHEHLGQSIAYPSFAGWGARDGESSVQDRPSSSSARRQANSATSGSTLSTKSGNARTCVTNPDTGEVVENPEGGHLVKIDFDDVKRSENVNRSNGGTTQYSPLWQVFSAGG